VFVCEHRKTKTITKRKGSAKIDPNERRPKANTHEDLYIDIDYGFGVA